MTGMDKSPAEPPPIPPVPDRVRRPGISTATVVAIVALSIGAAVGIVLALANRGGAPPAVLRAGWTRHTIRAAGFRIDLPPGWDPVSTTSVDAAYNELKTANPQLAELVRGQLGTSMSRLIKFLAFDTKSPTLVEDFATNMNVVVAPLGSASSFSAFLEQTLQQLQGVPGTSDVRAQRGTLPAGESARVRASVSIGSGASAVQYATVQYLLVRGSTGYVISFATLPGQVELYLPQFEEVAKTLRFEG